MKEKTQRESPVPEELFVKVIEFLKNPPTGCVPLTRLEEQKLELLATYYRTDKIFRTWLVFSTDIFVVSALQGKEEILVDGLIKLKNIILD